MGEVCHQTCVAPIISFEGLGNDRISQKSLQASSYYRKKHSSDTRYSHLASNLLCESGNTTFQLTKIINRSNFRQQQYREGRHNVDQRGCKRGGSSCRSPRLIPWKGPLVNVAYQPFPFWICRRQDPCGSSTSQTAGGPGPNANGRGELWKVMARDGAGRKRLQSPGGTVEMFRSVPSRRRHGKIPWSFSTEKKPETRRFAME